jgi:hypothetical protein
LGVLGAGPGRSYSGKQLRVPLAEVRMTQERWLPVVGYESDYMVSDHGRVKRISASRLKSSAGRLLAINVGTKRGQVYPCVHFHLGGKSKTFRVHVLVFQAFHGPIPIGKEVNHKDGVKTNCRWDNLEAVTHLENIQHAAATGLFDQRGERNHQCVIDAEIVRRIRTAHVPGRVGYIKLSHRFGISSGHIRDIIKGKAWAHIL